MMVNMVKKDLKRKKIVNLVLFIFITLCTVFLASSVSNLMTTVSGLDYFAEQSELSDYFILASEDELTQWLEGHENVVRFEVNPVMNLTEEGILMDRSGDELEGEFFLTRLPQEMIIPLDFNNQPLEPLEAGEMAMTFRQARQHGIELGDMLDIQIGEAVHAFEVTQFVRDIMFFQRIFIGEDDFFKVENETMVYTYAIDVEDLDAFTSELNQEIFTSIGTRATAETFMNMFVIELMAMILLILVGVCLITISFVVLRFAIVFTLQEDHQEIGIMKAIGLKNRMIKKVYFAKYLFLACLGTGLGFVLSLPFGEWLMGDMRENIAFPDANAMFIPRLFSSLLIVLLILAFCYGSMRKLKRLTAMKAIRSGEVGERFTKKSLLRLHRLKFGPLVMHLALNDLLSNMKSYLILLIIFTLGFLLVMIPVNINNTFGPEKLAGLVQLPITDLYFDQVEFETTPFDGTVSDLRTELERMQAFYQEQGLALELQAQIAFSATFYTDSLDEGILVNSISQRVGFGDLEALQILRGTAPILSNEIALTEMLLDQLGLDIKDEVNLAVAGESQQFVITGSYQTFAEFGIAAHLPQQVEIHNEVVFGVLTIQGDFVDRDHIPEQMRQLEAIVDEATLISLEDLLNQTLIDAAIFEILGQLILIIVLFVNVLMIILMGISFMMRDLKQIAFVKNLGFKNQTIRLWQGLRILWVMALSLALGLLLLPGAHALGRLPFALLGAPEIAFNIDLIQVYVLYPLVFLLVTLLTLAVITLGVKKIGLHEMRTAD